MRIQIIEPPALLPVTLEEAKAECRIELDDETHDDDLTGYIESAVLACETLSRATLATTTFRETMRPCNGRVSLSRLPLQSVVSVEDGDGNPVTYRVDPSVVRPVLYLDTVPEYVVVEYVAGYEELPAPAKTAVRKVVKHLWRRSDDPIPAAVDALLDSVRVPYFA